MHSRLRSSRPTSRNALENGYPERPLSLSTAAVQSYRPSPHARGPLPAYSVEKLDFAASFGALISSMRARWSAV